MNSTQWYLPAINGIKRQKCIINPFCAVTKKKSKENLAYFNVLIYKVRSNARHLEKRTKK